MFSNVSTYASGYTANAWVDTEPTLRTAVIDAPDDGTLFVIALTADITLDEFPLYIYPGKNIVLISDKPGGGFSELVGANGQHTIEVLGGC